jgi:hypothetical protein
MKCRNRIPETGTTISGFTDNNNKIKKIPTNPKFFWHVTVNTHIFFFGLMMIKDLYLQMISIIDFIYIYKSIRQVSTDPITCGLNFL